MQAGWRCKASTSPTALSTSAIPTGRIIPRAPTASARHNQKSTSMKNTLLALMGFTLLAGADSAVASVHYVDMNSTNATPPYTNWTPAATNIQDAVNVAVAG